MLMSPEWPICIPMFAVRAFIEAVCVIVIPAKAGIHKDFELHMDACFEIMRHPVESWIPGLGPG
jgi:hypothetical protein